MANPSVAIQTQLSDSGAPAGQLSNLTASQIAGIKALFQKNIPGLPNFLTGLRPISAQDVQANTVMVQPMKLDPQMVTSVKYQRWNLFDIYFLVGDSTVDACTEKVASVGEIFTKLFSNNALNDRNGAAPSNQYKTYPGYWLDSEMTSVDFSVAFLLGKPGQPQYAALGNFQLRVQNVALA